MPIIPVIGSRGAFTFAPPFSSIIGEGVEFTCEAVRRISDYLANNEDVKSIAYTPYGLDDTVYNSDVETNAYIASIQSSKGHWHYVPYQYILTYNIGDGVIYRSKMLIFSLPSLPSDFPLSDLMTDIQNTITARLGVDAVSREVETSLPILISYEKHIETEVARQALRVGTSVAADLIRLNQEVQRLTDENTVLKNYIKSL